MTASGQDLRLVGKYLDGQPAREELSGLERRLREDPEVAEALASAGRMDAWLADHFREEKDVRNVAAILREVEAGRLAGRWWRSPKVWAAAAAAILILVGGAALWLHVRGSADGASEVLDGRVLAGGAEVRRIPAGTAIRVADSGPAVIRLADGSRATMEASSEAVLRGRTGERRQVVDLAAGGGSFQVAKGRGAFEVKTPVGRVTALGTEFSVRLVPAGGREGDGTRARAGRMALAVAVVLGTVEVQVGGQTHILREGQDQVFAPEGERKTKQATCSGELVAVEASAITVAVKKGEQRLAELRTIGVDGGTKVLVETDEMESLPGEGGRMKERPKVVEGSLDDLRAKVGQRVTVGCTEDGGRALKVLIYRAAPPRQGKEKEGGAAAVPTRRQKEPA